jgi:hypothetical protein
VLLREVADVYPRTGRDFQTGRRAARLLGAAGLQDVQVRVIAKATAPGEYFQTFLLTLATLGGNIVSNAKVRMSGAPDLAIGP